MTLQRQLLIIHVYCFPIAKIVIFVWQFNIYLIYFTCCNITYIPNSQAVLLSSEGVDKGKVRATWSTKQHPLFRKKNNKKKSFIFIIFVNFEQTVTLQKQNYMSILTIFISRECTRLGLLPKMSQILTCLSAEEVTRHPLTWLLRSKPAAIQ